MQPGDTVTLMGIWFRVVACDLGVVTLERLHGPFAGKLVRVPDQTSPKSAPQDARSTPR